jgi:hypothetical protein
MRPNSSKVKPRELIPGDVVVYQDTLALVISNEYPATTIPRPENERYCEPGLVILKHVRSDMWVRTHLFTYVALNVKRGVKTCNSIRVQSEFRGKFQNENERKGRQAA